ncbi:hypothetical protein BDZ89DRAFT_170804 [Hymenopellis radicata]|nr:hypothetical protein BDZ89DRAFT_170804 [Hymenopellis radicata]
MIAGIVIQVRSNGHARPLQKLDRQVSHPRQRDLLSAWIAGPSRQFADAFRDPQAPSGALSPTSPSTSQTASPPLLVPSEEGTIYRRSTSVPTSQQASTSTVMVKGEGFDLSSKWRLRSLHKGGLFYPMFFFTDTSASADFNYFQVSPHHVYPQCLYSCLMF